MVPCKFLDTTEECLVVKELSSDYFYPTQEDCKMCSKCDPPQSVNLVTLTISNRILKRVTLPSLYTGPGPGTRLKTIISWWKSTDPDCGCEDRALIMDAWGIEGCKRNKNTIVHWLVDAARREGYPISRMAMEYCVSLLLSISPPQERFEEKASPSEETPLNTQTVL